MRFSVTEGDYPPDCHVVAVEGEIDLRTAPKFRKPLLRAVEGGHRVVVADLTKTRLVDSKGLHALVAAHKRLTRRGREFFVVASEPSVLSTLELTKLNRVFDVRGCLGDALSAAGCDSAAA